MALSIRAYVFSAWMKVQDTLTRLALQELAEGARSLVTALETETVPTGALILWDQVNPPRGYVEVPGYSISGHAGIKFYRKE